MRATIAVALAVLIASCGGQSLSLSVRAGPPATRTLSRSALTVANGIVLNRVRVVIRKVELEKAGTLEMDEIASGPYLLDLKGTSLDGGGVAKVFQADFTPGTYSEIKLEIHKPEPGEVGVNAVLTDMINNNASIIADGTIDKGTIDGVVAFSFATAVSAEQKFEGNLVLNNGSNLTLNVDPSIWFTSSTGRLDPTDPANRSQIESNIQSSFKAFKDDDDDGVADL
jgi:hypothetical protein